MSAKFMDPELILLDNQEWIQLEEKWGKPVDLETEDDSPGRLRQVFSTLDLMKSTFDSSFMFKKVRRKVGRKLSKRGVSDYKDFVQELKKKESLKEFYCVSGQMVSAASVEGLCSEIDDIFKSIEELYSSTNMSTLRGNPFSDVVDCSISVADLPFDDVPTVKEQENRDDVSEYIDKAFGKFNHLSTMKLEVEETRTTVMALVKKFTSILSNSSVSYQENKEKESCVNFKELADFWKNRAFNDNVPE